MSPGHFTQSDHEVGFTWDAMIGCPGEFYLSTEYLHEWKDVWEKLAAVIACHVLLPTDCINEFCVYKLLQRDDIGASAAEYGQ